MHIMRYGLLFIQLVNSQIFNSNGDQSSKKIEPLIEQKDCNDYKGK